MPKPYVVSNDIFILLQPWAKKLGLTLPSPSFFQQLRSELQIYLSNVFGAADFIGEDELCQGLQELSQKAGIPSVSLDQAYLPGNFNLELSRYVDSNKQNRGVYARWDSKSLPEQLTVITGVRQVALVDDVIYSGELMERVVRILAFRGIKVTHLLAGVGIGQGVERLRQLGLEVSCVREYNLVFDEVCERDFYPGVPFSGRSLIGSRNVGMPYLLPFGKPSEWASIPEDWVSSFSKFCISQTISLFEAIEHASGREVMTTDLERRLILPEGRFTAELRNLL